jgi:hypothetical protein
MYCKFCGVELEDDMRVCPLCGEPVNAPADVATPTPEYGSDAIFRYNKMSRPQKKFTWEIVSIILLSAAVTTFMVNFIINHQITWSEYPIAIDLTIFCYVSLFAFCNQSTLIQMTGGLILSSLCLLGLDALTGGIQWSAALGIPLLFASNGIVALLVIVIRRSKVKGLNLIGYTFLGAATLCVLTDGIISKFKTGLFQMKWSVIVTACTIPVVVVLLFVHFRLKRGRSLKKTFHL